ncbi:MAG: HAD family phosphatase [Armatimonadetes bacterium]|nr:HAD family phosphatase [Armatimonadota bacterium]
MPVRTLFLDIGGVLLTNGWDREMRRRACENFDLDYASVNDRHALAFPAYEEGRATLDEYLDRVVFEEPRPFSRDDFRRFMLDQSQPYPETLEFMRSLKKRHGLRVGVVSNEGRELTLHRVRSFHLDDFIDFFVVSCFVNLRKPDPEIYRLALDLAQTDPHQVAYVEDRDAFVQVARGLGIQAVQHRQLEGTRAALAQLGLD